MDWFLHPPSPATAARLRRQIARYLAHHATDADRLWAAEAAVAELIGNAVDHTDGPVWVSLDWSNVQPVLTVHDLGPTFELDPAPPDAAAERGRGLWMVSQMASELVLTAKRASGKRISVTLPVARVDEPSFDPPPREVNPLPALDEAGPDGFGREAFLRALVVELAMSVEEDHGPLVAQAAIARVGATIGGQMEREYRKAHAIVNRLRTQQTADCYIRLKAAVGGGFYPIEVTDHRIVLGNSRCPFGDAVHGQPALCRVTSSIFGGIGCRNHGETVVVINERIAFGDPECRVTVLFGEEARTAEGGHRYTTSTL
ncbi:MAG: ATP-binding protein [Dactylosporangium sp.]|nr:ATP-binding protein [Dactylosporangium sp.]NNJ61255.1 ATP-binding protein [Dactylosporangium sp.]